MMAIMEGRLQTGISVLGIATKALFLSLQGPPSPEMAHEWSLVGDGPDAYLEEGFHSTAVIS